MKSRLESYLLFSLAVHAALFGLLALFRHPLPVARPQETIAIEIRPENAPVPGAEAASKRPARGAPNGGRHASHSSHLFQPSIDYTGLGPNGLSIPKGDDPVAKWGESNGDMLGNLADFPLMQKVFERVNGELYYPGLLAAHKIQGMVNARLIVDADGHCDWHRTTISAADPHLRIFILSILKDTCAQDYSRSDVGKRSINVDMSFRFSLTEHNDKEIVDEQNKIAGHVLLFFRNSQQSVAEWHLGPLRGLFPIPFVGVDFAWLEENWDRVMKSKNPMAEFDKQITR